MSSGVEKDGKWVSEYPMKRGIFRDVLWRYIDLTGANIASEEESTGGIKETKGICSHVRRGNIDKTTNIASL